MIGFGCALLLTLGPQIGHGPEARFRVVNCFEEGARAEEAREVADAVVPILLDHLGATEWNPRRPGTLRLYSDFGRFRAATARLNPGAPEARGFTSRDERTSHVTVQPATDVLQALGLARQTRRLIAHEVTHLVAFDLLPDMMSLPGWMVEGLADSVSHQALGEIGLARGIEEEPYTAGQILAVRELIRTNEIPRFGALLMDRLSDFEFEQRYALRWLFYEFLLRRHGEECAEWMRHAYMGRSSGGARERIRLLLQGRWTPQELVQLDEEFLTFVTALQPRWEPVAGVCEYREEGLLTLAYPSEDALLVSQTPMASVPFHLAGRMRFLSGGARQLHVVLGRHEGSFLLVAFSADWGVTVWRHESPGGRWLRLGSKEVPALDAQGEHRFRVEATESELSVALGGEEVLRVSLDGLSPLGPYGLGAQAGSVGLWSALEAEASE